MESMYKDLVDHIRDAYILIQDERIILASKHVAEYFGYSKDELIGMYKNV